MSDGLPPLNTLRVFDAVVRHMSFTRAGAELGMTQAAVSYQIKLLEDRIGAPVFLRLTRKLALTDAGQHLAPVVADTFVRLREAFTSVAGKSGGVLAVSSTGTFTTRWLVPRIGKFQLAYPEIAVRMDVGDALVDFTRDPFDVGIRSGLRAAAQWPGLAKDHVLSIDLAPFCAPELAARFHDVPSPAALMRLPLLGEFNPARPLPYGVEADWRSWFDAAGAAELEIPAVKASFGTQQLLAAAAMTGQGVALLTPEFFRSELDSGRLIQLSQIRLKNVESYHLVCLAGRREVPKVRAFRDWLQSEIAIDLQVPLPVAPGWTVGTGASGK
jgi:LysR family transcriptional regulator, glycine cleavage system transcriptional activator